MALYDRLSDSTPSPPQSGPIISRRSKDSHVPSLVEAFGGVAKKRAPKACICCRRRKVRCDVSDFGSPCSNCRFDKVVCLVKESRRNRRRSSSGDNVAVSGWKTNARDLENINLSKWKKDLDGVNIEDALTPGFQNFDDEDLHVPHLIYQMQEHRAGTKAANIFPNASNESSQVYQLPQPPTLANCGYVKGLFPPTIELQPPKVNTISPMFRGLPSRIAEEDVEYLWAKGALSIPETSLRNELLRSYIEHVHSHMPIIDLKEFLEIVERGDGQTGQLSLLLYQCVMFAGSAFIALEHLKAIGFATRFEARKVFFTKVRVLYDLDYENDRISLVQSLLLMTHWYEQPDDQKDLWYWTGVVASLSLQIGLHRPCTDPRVDTQRRKLYKRIGWACFIRDQLVALGTQRPTRIKLRDHTLPILNLSDFDLEPLSESLSCVLKNCAAARDTKQIQNLASTAIEVAKLSLCMGHVLDTQYTMVKDDTPGLKLANIRMLLPKSSGPESDEVLKCDAELESWKRECADDAQHTEIPQADLLKGQEPIMGHRALLEMIYHAGVIALHRPLATSQDPSLQSEARSRSASRVQTAAFAITRITKSLLTAGLIPFMPSHGPTVILQGIMVHLVTAASPDEHIRVPAIEAYRVCMQGMHIMRDVHNGADVLIRLIEMGMKQRGALNVENINNLPKAREHSSSSSPRDGSRRMSTSSEKSNKSQAELMAVLGARVYTPPARRQTTPAEIAAPDPRLLFESSGLMVDEKLFGGWPVAKALLQTMLGLENAVEESIMENEVEEDEFGLGEEASQEEEQKEEAHTLHADFMEYVDEMVDFGFGEEGEEEAGEGIDTSSGDQNAPKSRSIERIGNCLVVDEDGVCIVRDNGTITTSVTQAEATTEASRTGDPTAMDLDVDIDMDMGEDMATPTQQSEDRAALTPTPAAAWKHEDHPSLSAEDRDGFGSLLLDIEELRSAYP